MRTFCTLSAALLLATIGRAQDMPLSDILIPGEGWKKVEGKFKPVAGLDMLPLPSLVIVWGADNEPQSLLDENGKPTKIRYPDELKRVPRTVRGPNLFEYVLSDDGRFLLINSTIVGKKIAEVSLETRAASAVALTPDGETLMIGDGAGKHIWAYRVGGDGLLSAGEKYLTMRVLPYVPKTLKEKPQEEPRSDVSAIQFDSAKRTYAATKIGVQVFDPTGRLCGVLTNPSTQPLTGMSFGGNGDRLFIACGTEIYFRKLNAKWPFPKPDKK